MLRLDNIAVAAKDVLSFGGSGISKANKGVCGTARVVMQETPKRDLGQNLVVLDREPGKRSCMFHVRRSEHRVANGKDCEFSWHALAIGVNTVKISAGRCIGQGTGYSGQHGSLSGDGFRIRAH